MHDENVLLTKRLRNCISVETVKKALEDKDSGLVAAWEEVKEKAKRADDKLKELRETKEINDHYMKELTT